MDPFRGLGHPQRELRTTQGPLLEAKVEQEAPSRVLKCPPLEATVGSLWGALGTLWGTFWVILEISGRQRGLFLRQVPELRKYKEFF